MANKVQIEIDGNNKGAIEAIKGTGKELDKLEREASGFSGKINSAFKQSSQFFQQHATAIKLGAIAVAGSLGFMIKSAIDTADEMSKTSQRIGVSVESLSTLKYAADLADVSLEQLSTGVGMLSRNLMDSSLGKGEAQEAFQILGIKATDVNGKLRSTESVLLEVADKFSTMENGTLKTALAMDVFGRSGKEMIPLLNAGADGIRELQEEAKALGLEISTSTALKAEQFNDNVTRMGYAVRGVGLTLATELLPTLETASGALVQLTKDTEGVSLAAQGVGVAIKSFLTLLLGVYAGAVTAGMAIGTLGATIATFLTTGSFDQAGRVFEMGFKKIETFALNIGDTFSTLWSEASKLPAVLESNVNDFDNWKDRINADIKDVGDNWVYLYNLIDKEGLPFEELYPMKDYVVPKIAGGAEDPRTKAEKQRIADITDFDLAMQALRAEGTQQMFGDMSNAALGFYELSGNASREWFAVYKAFAIAQTGIATYQAAMEAYKSLAGIPIVGPALGYAAAAAATAMGLANIARIASMQPGGGVTGAAAPSGGSAPRIPQSITNSSVSNSSSVIINVNVDGRYDLDNFVRTELVPSLKKYTGDSLGGEPIINIK